MAKDVIILGIDTSCDETSVALLRNRRETLANVISSQVDLHRLHGGVVPEIASRAHLERFPSVLEEAFKQAGVRLRDVSGVAVTSAPGLIGCLLVGLSFAKSFAYSNQIPLTLVHHLKGHLMSAFLGHEEVYPFLGLIVSGGHTALYHVRSFDEIEMIGTTVDDAAGEAFDKVAKLLSLGYPGGPLVDQLARQGSARAYAFTRARVKKGKYLMSFSGLKTAMAQYASQEGLALSDRFKRDLCASFQEEACGSLVEKVAWALEEYEARALVVAGGVACNSRLREMMGELARARSLPLFIPSPLNCTDNAAMIAYVGARQIQSGGPFADLKANARASIPLELFYR